MLVVLLLLLAPRMDVSGFQPSLCIDGGEQTKSRESAGENGAKRTCYIDRERESLIYRGVELNACREVYPMGVQGPTARRLSLFSDTEGLW